MISQEEKHAQIWYLVCNEALGYISIVCSCVCSYEYLQYQSSTLVSRCWCTSQFLIWWISVTLQLPSILHYIRLTPVECQVHEKESLMILSSNSQCVCAFWVFLLSSLFCLLRYTGICPWPHHQIIGTQLLYFEGKGRLLCHLISWLYHNLL